MAEVRLVGPTMPEILTLLPMGIPDPGPTRLAKCPSATKVHSTVCHISHVEFGQVKATYACLSYGHGTNRT